MQKTYTFHVNGMHCKACVALTESELNDVPEVSKAKSSLANHSVEVTGEFSALGGSASGGGETTPETIANYLSQALKHTAIRFL
jgi:cation transport ATPase